MNTAKSRTVIFQTLTFALLLVGANTLVSAQGGLMIYPKNGQSSAAQTKDTSECQSWAAQQSGYDPAAATSERGTVARGGARGAAAGAAIGAIAGDAGKGAAIGATAGGMKKGFERRDQKRTAQAGQADYDRALKTCLEGRGYSVN